MIEVVPLSEFVHGSITAHEGRAILMPDSAARDLERIGLVRIRVAQVLNRPASGKEPDDGQGQPSSVSPAAPVSPTMTLHLPKRGGARHPKTEK